MNKLIFPVKQIILLILLITLIIIEGLFLKYDYVYEALFIGIIAFFIGLYFLKSLIKIIKFNR
jgi:hypothetical protein